MLDTAVPLHDYVVTHLVCDHLESFDTIGDLFDYHINTPGPKDHKSCCQLSFHFFPYRSTHPIEENPHPQPKCINIRWSNRETVQSSSPACGMWTPKLHTITPADDTPLHLTQLCQNGRCARNFHAYLFTCLPVYMLTCLHAYLFTWDPM